MMISPCAVFIFHKILFFWGCWWGKRAKMAQNSKESLSVTLHILETIHHMIVIYGIHV